MSRPTVRVLALLEILQTGGIHTAADLARRLGVDERTLRRYVEHLLDLDLPVESVRGRYGGYRLGPGLRMPPLMLTDEEALAVVLGLVATSSEAAGSAAAKVRRVLPRKVAARLDALAASADFLAPEVPAPRAAVLLTLAEATTRRRPATITYIDRTGRHTERTVHPYGLVAHSRHWYLSAAADAELRTFRLDRIGSARLADGTFAVPEGFEPAEAVRAGTPWRHPVTVAVRGPADQVRARLPPGLAGIEPGPDDGWLLVRLRAERLDWLPAVLAGLGLPFVVLEPAELRVHVREWADRLAGWSTATSPAELRNG
ncbi:helix-turn-helix transcriptional regulator [Paractinoplanes maris]|uniref:helix-turn-helix transcriptional regulator n=1 Tax=Paractinoplanes maris TaxID=1734446 RepID=UPI00201FF601|nr:YafY family protein [Actinoplanes maris]